MINKLKKLLKGEKKDFTEFCESNNLKLDYTVNKNEIGILKSIFGNREYSDYFPFYEKVNIIDIGAHFGYFSIFAHNNTDADSRIIVIEPNKNNFSHLTRNIADCKIGNIKGYNCAIGGNTGKVKLFEGASTNNSIIENYTLLTYNKNFEEIECKTLEEIIIENKLEEVDFLKIDCEGAEYAILENTPEDIFKRITTISMEFHDLKTSNISSMNLIKKLVENGFEIVKYGYEKTSINMNYGKIIGTKIFKNFKG
jgi:FkbM family methyltransferase